MVTAEEGWHTLSDGERLYTKTWKPETDVKAKIVFVHGFSDHCNAYGTLFPDLADQGIEVYGFDQRGWGHSVKKPADRGLTGPTPLVLSDITSILNTHLPSAVPLFLAGHSMGGAEILTYAADGPPAVLSQLSGFIAEAPFIALDPKSRPWGVTVAVGRLLGKLWKAGQMEQKLDPKLLSRDPEVQKQWKEDELCHDMGTLEGMAGMLDRAAQLENGEVLIKDEGGKDGKKKLWISHGTDDKVCSFAGTKSWFELHLGGVDDKTFKVYDGWYHKLHAEPGDDKHIFSKDLAEWTLAHL